MLLRLSTRGQRVGAVTAALCALAAFTVGPGAPGVSAASSASTTTLTSGSVTVLGLSAYTDMVADSVHGHVFVSGGYPSPYIDVLTTKTGVLSTIKVDDVTGLALSPNDSLLYAASSDGNRIVAINTTTLAVAATYSTGSQAPIYLAYAGGYLWYTSITSLDFGRLNVSTGQASLTSVQAPAPGAQLVSSAAAPNVLAAGTLDVSPGVADVYDVSTGTPVYVSGTANLPSTNGQDPCDGLGGFAITQNGQDAVLTCDRSSVSAYTLKSFAAAGSYNIAPADYAQWVAVSPNGQIAAGACNEDGTSAVDVFNAGGATPVAQAIVPDYYTKGVVWDGPNTVYAISNTPPTSTYTLREYTL